MSIALSCLALLAACPAQKSLSILFCGNSHTSFHDVPGLARQILESSPARCKAATKLIAGAFLNDIWSGGRAKLDLDDRKFDFVVLQGAQLSSSHRFEYNNDGAVALARYALGKGARVLFFAEWPRRGCDESAFQLSNYRKFAKRAGGAEVVPVCLAWDAARKEMPKLDMWADDGNHADLEGSYLAALTLAHWMTGGKHSFSWVPEGMEKSLAALLHRVARKAASAKP